MSDKTTEGKTGRGFDLIEFKDQKGYECSLQKSSVATDDCVWLGCNDLDLRRFEAFIGWSKVELADIHPSGPYYVSNTRMHLTRDQVAALLPYLQRFVETGELS
jgi:hypothetical protein